MAESIGAVPVRLPPGSKAAYHAAAVLAAGGVVALLDAIREIAGLLGLDEEGALGDLPAARRADAGQCQGARHRPGAHRPAHRGDVGTVAAHLAALRSGAPDTLAVYRALLARDARIAAERGSLSPESAERLRDRTCRQPVTR